MPALPLAALLIGLAGPQAPSSEFPDREEVAAPAAALGKGKPRSGEVTWPPEIAHEVAAIEAEHLAVLGEPIERWQLAPVRSRYENLLKRVTDPSTAAALRARLDLVARHEQLARSAREFRAILDRSRHIDKQVAATLSRLAEQENPGRRPFVAEGLIQASSRFVDGHRVYALIGRNGEPIAYLDVPPGLDARPALTKRIGVRGSVRYNESLGSRLIAVKDLEPLE